jgi:hypothetical protein
MPIHKNVINRKTEKIECIILRCEFKFKASILHINFSIEVDTQYFS